MIELFNNLPFEQKVYWGIALFSTVVFIIQSIMTFMGMDAHDGADADFSGHDLQGGEEPFQLFTFRNLISFLLGFSWTGIGFSKIIDNPVWLMILAFLVGVLFVGIFFFILRQMMRLAEDNSFNINHVLNQIAEVYIPIPEQRKGKGKVSISVRGSVHEIDALTDGETRIASGASVRIVKIESESLVLVERL
ncbi:MAG: serine protease [Tannerella sp.]|jgi:membrane protein implicated in regulation of membrane protease activity|nr:serine protease [Tannerella sp.]